MWAFCYTFPSLLSITRIGDRGWYEGFYAIHLIVPFYYEDRYTGVVCGLFTTYSLATFHYEDRGTWVVCGLFTTCSLAPFHYKDRDTGVVCELISLPSP